MKTECEYLNGWIKNAQKSHQNGEPQRYSWGTQKKKKDHMFLAIYTGRPMVHSGLAENA